MNTFGEHDWEEWSGALLSVCRSPGVRPGAAGVASGVALLGPSHPAVEVSVTAS